MVAPTKNRLGNGLYTVAEAALYARVPTPLMSRWLFGTSRNKAVIDPFYGTSRADRRVSFLDLVQTLAIREIRIRHDVPLEKFRQAIKLAEEKLHFTYPFAREHCTYLMGDELVVRPPDSREEFIEASGNRRGQRLIPFVEMYLTNLSFGPDGLASVYHIYQSRHRKPVTIRMDPTKRFGEPLLPSGYTPTAVWKAIESEGGLKPAAGAYGIPLEEVETAYQFVVNHLGKAIA